MRGVRETEFIEVVDEAPDVIRVGVRRDDLGDALGVDARRGETIGELADGRLPGAPGAGIDQDQLFAVADESDVDAILDVSGRGECVAERGLDRGRLHIAIE